MGAGMAMNGPRGGMGGPMGGGPPPSRRGVRCRYRVLLLLCVVLPSNALLCRAHHLAL
jgi:hypothetical protein